MDKAITKRTEGPAGGKGTPGAAERPAVFSGAVLVLGASGIIAQLLLLRELLITFQSNELSIGIVLANWLVLEAAGSCLGRAIDRARRKVGCFVSVTLVFSLCLPAAVYLARTWKILAGASTGEGVGFHQIFLASLLILLPVSLAHGALFTFACRIGSSRTPSGAVGIGWIYFLETAGTLAGGLVFTSLMITLMNSFQVALTVSAANVLFCLFLVRHRPDISEGDGLPIDGSRLPGRAATVSGAILVTGAALILLGAPAEGLHRLSIRKQWQGQKVVHYQNSVYGNAAVIEREGQFTFFLNGVPVITAPVPDVAFVEEFAHLPMLLSPHSDEVLVISGGAGGVINELLKHGVERIDYAELDPLILKLAEKFPTDLTERELKDPRVHVHYGDGRLFLKEAPRLYDVVLVGLSNPQDLQVNRFFTRQFFSLVSRRLKENGVLAFTLPGSLTYLGVEVMDLNACVLNTLGEVFPAVRVIPGDGYNIHLASPSRGMSDCDVDCVQERFRRSAPAVRSLNSLTIAYRLDPRWSRWFFESMAGATKKINEDFRPLAVFYSLAHWNAKFAPGLQRVLVRGEKMNLSLVAGALAVVFFPLLLLVMRSKDPKVLTIPAALASTGFAGMLLALSLMFTFQALYGVVFYWVGLLVTAFMAGTAVGSLAMTRIVEGLRNEQISFLAIEAALIVLSLALPLIFIGLETYLDSPGLTGAIRIMFLILSMSAGLLIGMEFPLASKIYMGSSRDVGRTAGLLYAADLMGGWAGGIAGGVVLLPVIGLAGTCIILALMKLATFILIGAGLRVRGEGA